MSGRPHPREAASGEPDGGASAAPPGREIPSSPVWALLALCAGGAAFGAASVGALAIGALAVGRLSVGLARIRRLEVGELVVDRLTLRAPPQSD